MSFNIKRLVISALTLACLLSCSDDSDHASKAKFLPIQIEMSRYGDTLWDMTYDGYNRIETITMSDKEGVTSFVKMLYDGNDTVEVLEQTGPDAKAKIDQGTSTVFKVQGGSLLRNGQQVGKVDKHGRMISHTLSYQGKETSYTYDGKGNIASMTYRPWEDERTATHYYSHDRKNGIFRHVATPKWLLVLRFPYFPFLHNNMVNEFNDTEGKDLLYSYTNSYNTDDYPVEVRNKPEGVLGVRSYTVKIKYTEAE